ncbi:MAG: hydantoinase [Deltaproteobacteria bacterium CG_4_8_14_3_um_filter_51_11]|nr:hydantoinase/oxoprolinase family protein [bacterium]OIP37960.1 MAG: hydantoinase [Desulfobacteraceae bacterium CG2_30_51_40]PIP48331.1 MAG: hydantoinase [Deltaproteobacteria bacterium CG23_combo_of_CG06-09_8_20_14_all_51_20]PIV99958.1 MAG: hydantoinase [Deltaproteobacteria bacterium CG17_big_fil_post_rev_8_21_14_2_50_51_6]PIX19905.1 MAG: hydantoinase [Deltaproteobacteria bacterium CG_4_8_14_3_um_filter_51_11]PIY22321.1 MAG: hydantoinase [Deltaproteobacteria bacterium CG_4_10_14_3_um_filter_
MILGLDVGGTQTDAVILSDGKVLTANKTDTGEDLLETLRISIGKSLEGVNPAEITRMSFSTTLATNAIVQDTLDPTGMIVSAGPGMRPEWWEVGPSYHVVEGCVDHQGFEALPLDGASVVKAASIIKSGGISTVGVVGKFSVRNPLHEIQIAGIIKDQFSHVALGHRVSGILNFPRRINTTYLNAALHRIQNGFVTALSQSLDERGLTVPRYLLKPDGGTTSLRNSCNYPAIAAQSGPAASVIGALALDGCSGTTLILDVGGTTTDMAVVEDGVPFLETLGIRLGPYKTLVRSLLTHSVGIGGDSELRLGKKGDIRIGPMRVGRPRAFGGPAPTPTDAMICLGLLDVGRRELAHDAMQEFALSMPGGSEAGVAPGAKEMSVSVLEKMGETIALSARAFIHELNSRPVYTIYEVLHREAIEPSSAIVIGGPALQLAPYLEKAMGIPCRVPEHYGVANAVGAAVARVTSEVTLQADTYRGTAVIPEAGIQEKIDGRFNIESAISMAKEALREFAARGGGEEADCEISIAERQVFHMIRDYSRTGQNIRVKICITPGIIKEWRR